MINELQESMSAGASQQALGSALEKLAEFTYRHFVIEESVIHQHNVPGFQNHKLEHEKLRSQVARFAKGLSTGNVAMSLDMAKFLGLWLINHIQFSDKKYAPYLNGKLLPHSETLPVGSVENARRDVAN